MQMNGIPKFRSSWDGNNERSSEPDIYGQRITHRTMGYPPTLTPAANTIPSNNNGPSMSTVTLASDPRSVSDTESVSSTNSRQPKTFYPTSKFILVLRHVRNESVFWDGKYSLQPEVLFQGNPDVLNVPVGSILAKYVPKAFYSDQNDDGGPVLVNNRFEPIDLNRPLGELYTPKRNRMDLFLRSRDFSLENEDGNNSGRSDTEDEEDYCNVMSMRSMILNNRVSSTILQQAKCVQFNIEEVCGRQILWDARSKGFTSSVRLVYEQRELSGLKVDDVLGRVLASGYFENTHGVLERRIWTDKIKVLSLKDSVDVLFLSINKCNIYLKYINNLEDLQWQDIADGIKLFMEKIPTLDDSLKKFYEENQVVEEMEVLRSRIHQDNRDEDGIERMMKKLEPKLNLALNLINILDLDGTVPPDLQKTSKNVFHGLMKKANNKHIRFSTLIPPLLTDSSEMMSVVDTGTNSGNNNVKGKDKFKAKFYEW